MKNDLDILLIHPNAAQKIYQKLSDDFSAIEPPIWCGMIAKYLLNKGYNVQILDCEAEKLTIEESFEKVKGLNPRLVAMIVYGQQPSASSQNMHGSELLLSLIKNLGIPRVYVGPTPSAVPEFIINKDKEVFVCNGEGPITLDHLLKIKDHSTSELERVPGLCFYNHDQKTIIKNKPANLFSNLDEELPSAAWELMDFSKYRTANWHGWTNNPQYVNEPFASIYTSLGCPFQCQFCMINAPFNNGDNKNNTFRTWSIERTMQSLRLFANKGITNLKIADELFVLKPPHFLGLCNAIIKEGLKFNIWAYARIDTIREDYLKTLKAAGVNWLGLGIESGNLKIRQEVTKGKFQETNIKNIIDKINKYDICATGNYIFGLPSDTNESMKETLDFALTLETSYVNFYTAMAYPGSQLHRDFSKTNPQALPENNENVGWLGYSQHSYETFNLPTKFLKNSDILAFREKAFQTYFSDEKFLTRMTRKFGNNFISEVNRMKSVPLKRKLLE